ncbi:hypothetical protein [Pseudofrankia sp. BMG5.36]|uniref:hypothetical protein n=1 Tax=Pseudofrankia sp. BMG5.36 TaxID=1834512 RepID=UPI0008D9F8CA|nr:hypothetical protein [Pseudofrankia sp. BMG5.36]OHV57239.1 hypothetical protein BCD48_43120 [Pseudofrankia sp. BMG5.36]
MISQIQDVTEQVAAEFRLGLVLENAPVSIVLADAEGRVLYRTDTANPQAAQTMPVKDGDSIDKILQGHPRLQAMVRRSRAGEHIHEIHSMDDRSFDLHLFPVVYGSALCVAVLSTEVTARERALEQVRQRSAEQAILADLAPRALESLEPDVLWRRVGRSSSPNTWTPRSASGAPTTRPTLARTVTRTPIGSDADILPIADRILERLVAPTTTDGHGGSESASVGIALSDPSMPDGDELLRAADIEPFPATTCDVR